MRIKRSVVRFFGALVIPAMSLAVSGYFGAYAVWGERGVLALEDVQTHLSLRQQELAEVRDARERLQRRVALMTPGSADPDLVEELARDRLMDGGPGQVAVPRARH